MVWPHGSKQRRKPIPSISPLTPPDSIIRQTLSNKCTERQTQRRNAATPQRSFLNQKTVISLINMPHALTSRDSIMESKPVGSYTPTGIDVLIIGTGLAGLVAALECVRKGHNVRVLERNSSINTAGKIVTTKASVY